MRVLGVFYGTVGSLIAVVNQQHSLYARLCLMAVEAATMTKLRCIISKRVSGRFTGGL